MTKPSRRPSTRHPLYGFLAFIIVAISTPAAFAQEEPDAIRLVYNRDENAATPYQTIRYEITRLGDHAVLSHRRRILGLEDSLHAMALLTPEETDALFDGLRAHLSAAPHPAPQKSRPGDLLWSIVLILDGELSEWTLPEPTQNAAPSWRQLFRDTRDLVLARTGELPFRNVFFPHAQRGWINIESVPPAQISIDGQPIQRETPLYAYDIQAGEHEITLDASPHAPPRTFKVRIEAQGTTSFRIDLR